MDKSNMYMEPGVGDINVMVKPSVLKDKTPMCLVNELARYNRIQHQYRLIKEEGPPHRKKFTVTLKLGDCEYEAQGTSIKKAQHEAAAIALRSTKYKHPPPKLLPNTRVNTTPTVELNALAMKRGEPTFYTMLSQPVSTYFHPSSYPMNYYSRNIYQARTMYSEYTYNDFPVTNGYSYPRNHFNNRYKNPGPYKVSLKMGSREYIAEGSSAQIARHKAARKALEDLRNLPEPDMNGAADGTSENPEGVIDDFKSPISIVHEKAFRHNLQATFEVIDERGPPHMRTFVTQCRIGDKLKTVGEGNGKKVSKRRAAEKMLTLLETLPPPPKPPISVDKKRLMKRIPLNKKRNRVIKDPIMGDGNKPLTDVNPTTRLMEYQKKRHAKEPVYILVEEKGRGRKKQFSIEVKVDDLSFVGTGTSKKDAKRQASEGMIKLLGLDSSSVTKEAPQSCDTIKEAISPEVPSSPMNGKQIAPGILLVPHADVTPKLNSKKQTFPQKEISHMTNETHHIIEQMLLPSQQYTSQKNNLDNFNIQKNTAKDQLIRLVDTFGYEVQIADFPKGHHHQEFLSLVTLNTNPPQTYYGSGSSTKNAQNEAAYNALSMISEMGVEALFSKKMSAFIPEKEMVS